MKYVSIRKVLEHAGGIPGLQDILFRSGQPFPSRFAVAAWRARNAIAGSWVGAIIWALACKGISPLDILEEYVPPAALQDEPDEAGR